MISIEQQKILIQAQIQEWEAARYNAEIAHRVHTRLKSGAAALSDFAERMMKAEYAIDELNRILNELEA